MSKSYTTFTRVRKNLSGENDPVAQDLEPESSLSYVKLTIADKSFDIDPFDTNWIDTKHHNLSVAYSRQQYGTPPTTSETFTLTTTFSTTISTTSSTPGNSSVASNTQLPSCNPTNLALNTYRTIRQSNARSAIMDFGPARSLGTIKVNSNQPLRGVTLIAKPPLS